MSVNFVKAVRWKGWREGFKENVSFEFRVEKSMDNDSGIMMGQMSLDNSIEKSEKKNDQD